MADDRSCARHFCVARCFGAVAPPPPPAFEPYVIFRVAPPARVRPETLIVLPESERPPSLAVTWPRAAWRSEGADQPEGTVSVTVPFAIPTLAAVYVKTIV